MKKLIAITLAMFVGVGLMASNLVQEQVEDKTSELYLTVRYTTPYGVQKIDDEGNPVVDGEGNPVIAFEMRTRTEYPIIRIETKNGVTNAYWLSLGQNGEIVKTPYQGKQSIVALPMASSEKVYKRPNDFGRHGAVCLEYTVERGLGLAPVKCILSGHFTTGNMNKGKGVMYASSTSGVVVGFGSNGTQIAQEVTQLPIFGSFSMSYQSTQGRDKNIRKTLEKNGFVPNAIDYPTSPSVLRVAPRKLVRYYLCDFYYTTPYGVYALDANKNRILDEKGSPVVMFEIKHKVRSRQLLRFEFDEKGIGHVSAVKKYNKDSRNRYVVEWIPFGTLSYIPMSDGNVLGFMTYETTLDDRGIGITPAVCSWGCEFVEKFSVSNGQRIPSSFFATERVGDASVVAGFSIGEDNLAWELVENALNLEPERILPVYTSVNTVIVKGPVTLNNTQILKFVKNGTGW